MEGIVAVVVDAGMVALSFVDPKLIPFAIRERTCKAFPVVLPYCCTLRPCLIGCALVVLV